MVPTGPGHDGPRWAHASPNTADVKPIGLDDRTGRPGRAEIPCSSRRLHLHNAWMGNINSSRRHRRKHGTARGVAVFGTSGFADDSQGLTDLLGRHERLIGWMRAAGLELEVSAAGLQTVDAMVETWRDDPSVAPGLTNDVGIFLGDVMVHEISGARWHVWPNGHPVIRLADGKEIDVTAQTSTRVRKGRPHLNAILDQAAGAAKAGPTSGTD